MVKIPVRREDPGDSVRDLWGQRAAYLAQMPFNKGREIYCIDRPPDEEDRIVTFLVGDDGSAICYGDWRYAMNAADEQGLIVRTVH